MELISMTCRNCGGKLMITKNAEQIICQHCGTEFLICFNDGAISIQTIAQGIQKIEQSADKTASELALQRLKEEKDLLRRSIEDEIVRPMGKYYEVNYRFHSLDARKTNRFLHDELQLETNMAFKDKEKISLLRRLVELSDSILVRWIQIETEEKKHRMVVE